MSKDFDFEEYTDLSTYEKNKAKRKEKHRRKLKDRSLLIIVIVCILLGISVIFNIYLLATRKPNVDNSIQEELMMEKNRIDTELKLWQSEHQAILKEETQEYVLNKIDFFDKRIVFIIDGLGNEYYSYDCMLRKVGYKPSTYWAYNVENAIAKGYVEGKCE